MTPIELLKRLEKIAKRAKEIGDHYGKIPFTHERAENIVLLKYWRLKEFKVLKYIHDMRSKPVGFTAAGNRIIINTWNRMEYLMFLKRGFFKPMDRLTYRKVTEKYFQLLTKYGEELHPMMEGDEEEVRERVVEPARLRITKIVERLGHDTHKFWDMYETTTEYEF